MVMEVRSWEFGTQIKKMQEIKIIFYELLNTKKLTYKSYMTFMLNVKQRHFILIIYFSFALIAKKLCDFAFKIIQSYTELFSKYFEFNRATQSPKLQTFHFND